MSISKCGALREITGDVIRPGGFSLTERAAAYCGLAAGDRLLDVGCGAGASVAYLKDTHQIAAEGIDRSAHLLADGRRRQPGLPIRQGDARRLDVAKGSFRAVLCECSFSHFAEPHAVLAEFRRALADGGFLIISDISHGEEADEALGRMLQAQGFQVVLREDHTGAIRQLGARLIFRYGSLERFFQMDCRRCANCAIASCGGLEKLAYYLLIARKVSV